MNTDQMPQSFQDILRPHLPYAEERDLVASDDLGALGLDSMGVVALLGDIEDQLEIELPDEILNEETFATAGTLWATVSTLLGRTSA